MQTPPPPNPWPSATWPPTPWPPRHRREGLWLGIGLGAVAAVIVALVLLLVLPPTLFGAGPTRSNPVQAPFTDTQGGTSTGSGLLIHCGSGLPNTQTSWVCLKATAGPLTGYARGWYQFQSNYTFDNLSGLHYYEGVGALNLAPGFASMEGVCDVNAGGFARIYVFWHVWLFDATMGYYVDQSNSGYLWDSGTEVCPTGGGSLPAVSSPPMVEGLSAGVLPQSSATFLAGHVYVFTFFLGCTGQVSLTASSGLSQLSAGCNMNSASPSSNTFVEYGVSVR